MAGRGDDSGSETEDESTKAKEAEEEEGGEGEGDEAEGDESDDESSSSESDDVEEEALFGSAIEEVPDTPELEAQYEELRGILVQRHVRVISFGEWKAAGFPEPKTFKEGYRSSQSLDDLPASEVERLFEEAKKETPGLRFLEFASRRSHNLGGILKTETSTEKKALVRRGHEKLGYREKPEDPNAEEEKSDDEDYVYAKDPPKPEGADRKAKKIAGYNRDDFVTDAVREPDDDPEVAVLYWKRARADEIEKAREKEKKEKADRVERIRKLDAKRAARKARAAASPPDQTKVQSALEKMKEAREASKKAKEEDKALAAAAKERMKIKEEPGTDTKQTARQVLDSAPYDTDDLWRVTSELPIVKVPISKLSKASKTPRWENDKGVKVSVRDVTRSMFLNQDGAREHAQRIRDADMQFPILVEPGTMDVIKGLHRLGKAIGGAMNTVQVRYVTVEFLKSAGFGRSPSSSVTEAEAAATAAKNAAEAKDRVDRMDRLLAGWNVQLGPKSDPPPPASAAVPEPKEMKKKKDTKNKLVQLGYTPVGVKRENDPPAPENKEHKIPRIPKVAAKSASLRSLPSPAPGPLLGDPFSGSGAIPVRRSDAPPRGPVAVATTGPPDLVDYDELVTFNTTVTVPVESRKRTRTEPPPLPPSNPKVARLGDRIEGDPIPKLEAIRRSGDTDTIKFAAEVGATNAYLGTQRESEEKIKSIDITIWGTGDPGVAPFKHLNSLKIAAIRRPDGRLDDGGEYEVDLPEAKALGVLHIANRGSLARWTVGVRKPLLFQFLTHLSIDGMVLPGEGGMSRWQLPSLVSLQIVRSGAIPANSLKLFGARFPKLERLVVTPTTGQFVGGGGAGTSRLPSLRSLYVSNEIDLPATMTRMKDTIDWIRAISDRGLCYLSFQSTELNNVHLYDDKGALGKALRELRSSAPGLIQLQLNGNIFNGMNVAPRYQSHADLDILSKAFDGVKGAPPIMALVVEPVLGEPDTGENKAAFYLTRFSYVPATSRNRCVPIYLPDKEMDHRASALAAFFSPGNKTLLYVGPAPRGVRAEDFNFSAETPADPYSMAELLARRQLVYPMAELVGVTSTELARELRAFSV